LSVFFSKPIEIFPGFALMPAVNVMPAEFLSICIPTRNRCALLAGLLGRLEAEIRQHSIPEEVVRIYVSDNAASDETQAVVQGFLSRLKHLSYVRQPENIGGDRNILFCAQQAVGDYCWIVGDDDSINPGALVHILEVLKTNRPALFINYDGRYESALGAPVLFPNFQAFAEACVRTNPHMLVAHSLITANIFQRSRYDSAFAHTMLDTFYGHMYGLIAGIGAASGGVYVSDRHTITVRDSSASPVDGVWPANLTKMWIDYLAWLKSRFNLADLRPEAIGEYARLALQHEFKAHPLRFAFRYSRSLLRFQAYKTLWQLVQPTVRRS
jgi:glycosyltransferase involved in cell wall biosynthesis